MKPNKKIIIKEQFQPFSAVSPEEILAAGGATAFGVKTGKNIEGLKKMLRDLPKPEPFAEGEWDSLVRQLENDR